MRAEIEGERKELEPNVVKKKRRENLGLEIISSFFFVFVRAQSSVRAYNVRTHIKNKEFFECTKNGMVFDRIC